MRQADPDIVYVPSYSPLYAYGPPVYPYPSIYYPPYAYPYYPGMVAASAISFGVGWAMGAAWGGGWGAAGWNQGMGPGMGNRGQMRRGLDGWNDEELGKLYDQKVVKRLLPYLKPFPLPVAGISGGLKVAGASVGNLNTGDLGMLEPGGTKQITLPLTINFLSAASAANALRSGGNAQVKWDGKLVSGGQNVPLDVSQLLNFRR